MKRGYITMSEKEQERLVVMEQVKCGAKTIAEAAEILGVTYRHARRIHKRFISDGAWGVTHAARGKFSNNSLPQEFRENVINLYKEHLKDYGPTLAAEVLKEEYDVAIHRETLRRLLHDHHLLIPRCRPRKHRRRRPRRECFGELVQIDGSFHRWFGPERSECCLMVMVDDATGRMLCFFAEQETTEAAFRLYRKWAVRYGAPEALYADRKNIYAASREPNAFERRAGSGALTDFGRGCWRLGTRIILAHSPEAKGRVERMNGVLQDRLVKELARRQIHTIEKANAMLDDFTDRLSAKFAVSAASAVDRHRKRPTKAVLDEALCWEAERTLARDWTISYGGVCYQIERQKPLPRPGQRLTVRRYLDGHLAIFHERQRLRFHEYRRSRGAVMGYGNAVP